ncbi:hypothetical protein ACTXT7_004308 [Hymenolepis weldensis]
MDVNVSGYGNLSFAVQCGTPVLTWSDSGYCKPWLILKPLQFTASSLGRDIYRSCPYTTTTDLDITTLLKRKEDENGIS